MKLVFILTALIYSAPVFADTIKLSCSDHKKVEMNVSGEDVKLKITDLAPYPGRIVTGPATVVQTTDGYAISYKIDEYMLRKKRSGYTIFQEDKLSFCDVVN